MSLAKAVVTGTIYRAPEKRFTQNNIPVSSFVMNIGTKEEMLIRVIARKTSLDEVVSSLGKDDKVLVEGQLQITSVKTETGAERKIYEIDANSVETMEKISVSENVSTENSKNEEITKFNQEEFSDELIGEDEIPF